MASTADDKTQLWSDIKRYVASEVDYAKITATATTSILLAKITVVAVALVVGGLALYFIATAATLWLGAALDSHAAANIIVAAVLLLGLALVFAFRKQLIINPVTRALTRLFLSQPDNEQ